MYIYIYNGFCLYVYMLSILSMKERAITCNIVNKYIVWKAMPSD